MSLQTTRETSGNVSYCRANNFGYKTSVCRTFRGRYFLVLYRVDERNPWHVQQPARFRPINRSRCHDDKTHEYALSRRSRTLLPLVPYPSNQTALLCLPMADSSPLARVSLAWSFTNLGHSFRRPESLLFSNQHLLRHDRSYEGGSYPRRLCH